MNEVDDTANNPLLEFSVKLCAAVKKEKCLYDRISVRKNTTPDIEAAWDRVAKECNETIEYCKYRWKSMVKSFFRNYRRCNHYYLHDYMIFLKENDQQETINDDTNSIDKFNDDISRQESEIDTINMDEDVGSESDSQTASADEMGENTKEKNKRKFAMFLAEENEKDARDIERFAKRGRSNHKRACKRRLDPKLLSELADEDSGEKRSRKSLERQKDRVLTQSGEKGLSFKIVSVPVKIKQNTKIEEKRKEIPDIPLTDSFSYNKNDVKDFKKVNMTDSFTSTDIHCRNVSIQCSILDDSVNESDELFLKSLKLQLKKMNGRQRMNFKSKIFQSLMDVFDDPIDFPNSQEPVKIQQKTAPLLVNTTAGELRLMRELVSLVQAAKTTPEVMNAKDKITTTISNKTPTKTSAIVVNETGDAGLYNQTTHNVSSPSLDGDEEVDFHLSTENVDDEEDVHFPRSLDEIMVKSGDIREPNKGGNVMGLPKHVLQKVVKVAGTNGSTIVAREGDKRRIYRIYPKNINQIDGRLLSNKSPNSVGTFYVAPSKTGVQTSSTPLNKTHNSAPTISVKNFANKSANVANAYPTSLSSNSNQSVYSTTTKRVNSPALYKSVHPANRILNASTGLFQNPNSTTTSSPPPNMTSNGGKNPQASTYHTAGAGGGAAFITTPKLVPLQGAMLPPNSRKSLQVRSTHQSPPILQRRFSVCGPLPTEKANSSPNITQASSKTSKYADPHVSQIQISKPVSLNKYANSMVTNKNMDNNEKEKTEEPMAAQTKNKESPNLQPDVSKAKEMTTSKETEEFPIVETAGTITADSLDPLYVKQTPIKSEPIDD